MSTDGPGTGAVEARRSRISRVLTRMEEVGVGALLLSLGADLPWLTGYTAMPLERLTVLVLPGDGEAVLVVPALEAPRVPTEGDLFRIEAWADGEDPLSLVTGLLSDKLGRSHLAISDRTWATSLLALEERLPSARWSRSSAVTGPIRAVKDALEVEALRLAGAAADRVAASLQAGDIDLVGRTEAQVSNEIGTLLLAEGHRRVNFAIVGSGPNAASPHHEPGSRVIGAGETVVCDFGGSWSVGDDVGYCSDITRTVMTGEPDPEISECYEVLRLAQEAAVKSACSGVPAEDVDRAARSVIEDAGHGDHFVHRTGHGIGIEEHEDPFLVVGNREPLVPGHAFSVEPGIYVPGRFGMRLEDIVVIGGDGMPEPVNCVDHGLVVVDV
ncbi:MAG: M24 family metallopeptidase [Acidimicrobiales bacterium]